MRKFIIEKARIMVVEKIHNAVKSILCTDNDRIVNIAIFVMIYVILLFASFIDRSISIFQVFLILPLAGLTLLRLFKHILNTRVDRQ
jgi:hypothetical protein